jgi:hypothetical protein
MLVQLPLLVVLAACIIGALASKPFRPAPSLAPLRLLVTAMASAAGVMLAVSLSRDWWVVTNGDGAFPDVVGGEHFVPRWVATMGLVACVLTVAASWGRRNWAPLGLVVAWLAVGTAWFESSGEVTGTPTEARFGLRLATWAIVLVTLASVVGSLGRLAERRAPARA